MVFEISRHDHMFMAEALENLGMGRAISESNFAEKLMTKVAIVEDSTTLRQYLAELITNTAGHRCVCACASAEEAMVKIPEVEPHVVLMDIHLPGQSGIACTAY